MLPDFIVAHREEILTRVQARVAKRRGPSSMAVGPDEHAHGLPLFLEQLGDALRRATVCEIADHSAIKNSGGLHGDHLFQQGLTIAQVIDSYGDVFQVITGLATDCDATIAPAEFQTLHLCLDQATSGAVTAFSRRRECAITEEGTERLGALAHELRNALNVAMLSFACIKKGTVGTGGATSVMLDRSFDRLKDLVNRSLAEVRLEAGVTNLVRVPVWELLEEAEIAGTMLAEERSVRLDVLAVDHGIIVEADRAILAAAIANLVQNALKFTRPDTHVVLRAMTTKTRVLIEVEDHCGGLPEGSPESLARPFVQRDENRSGLGLGLSICVKAMKMMSGQLHIRDIPGKGCVFTIDLPKQPPPPTSIHAHKKSIPPGPTRAGGESLRAV